MLRFSFAVFDGDAVVSRHDGVVLQLDVLGDLESRLIIGCTIETYEPKRKRKERRTAANK